MNFYKNAQDAFEDMYNNVLTHGIERAGTKTVFNVGFYILNPLDNVIKTPFRKFNAEYAEAEWQWYLSGDPSTKKLGELYGKVPAIWKKMEDAKGLVRSNYGWQWSRESQLAKVIKLLSADKETRKASISIYDGKEIDSYSSDTPCTDSVHFQVIDDKLMMTVKMRSNDLIFGFCNDQYCFSKLQEMVATALGLKVGPYYHFTSNLHIYDRHYNMKNDFEQKEIENTVNLKHED